MDVLLLVAPLALTAAVCWVGVRRTRVELRRLSNAYWLLVGVLLAFQTLANLAVPGVAGLVTVVVAAPLLVLCLAIFLVLDGVWMLRTGSVRVGSVSLGTGIGLLALVGCSMPVVVLGAGRLSTGLAVVLLAAGYLGFQFVAFVGYTLIYRRLVPERGAGWLVVLGFGEGGGVTPLLASRIRTGMVECARRGSRMLVMCSGREIGDSGTEADAMADWAIAQGADPDVLVRENRSHDMEEGLGYSTLLVSAGGVGDGLVVTSNYQVLRVAILARKIGMPAHAVGAATAGYYWPSAIIREFAAVLMQRKVTHVLLIFLILLPMLLLVAH